MLEKFSPCDLQSLFNAFALLERGVSVRLVCGTESGFGSELPTSGAPLVGLYSSGSTGRPKLCWIPWSRLTSELSRSPRNERWTWASSFSPCTFAGVQVAAQAWISGGRVVSLGQDWQANWRMLAGEGVNALCCTPTFLDLMLYQRTNEQWNPSQVTLGGEPLHPTTGRRFRGSYPATRFSSIYASAELGVLLKTNRLDGWYEINSLERRYPDWRITEGELQVCKEGRWESTGDLVQAAGPLLRVIGRADSVANIAGWKVSLDEVSRLAEEVPGVRSARAFTEPNPVSGQIICMTFVPDPGSDQHQVQERLEVHLRRNLRKEAWPRRWEIRELELGPNGKRALK